MFTAIWGVILGAPTLRLRGDYLAIVTLAFGEIVPRVFENSTSGFFGIGQHRLLQRPSGDHADRQDQLPVDDGRRLKYPLELKPAYWVGVGDGVVHHLH